MEALPSLYFRLRENGAAVFRVGGDGRNRRLEIDQIAVVNVRNGEIKPGRGQTLSDGDRRAIEAWLAARQAQLTARARDEAEACIERLNLTAHWAQTSAGPDDLEAVTDRLILAMHDLRTVLVRKKAERLGRGPDD